MLYLMDRIWLFTGEWVKRIDLIGGAYLVNLLADRPYGVILL